MLPTILSTTSVLSTDSSTDGEWVVWSGKAGASDNSQIFLQKTGSPLAPRAISPDNTWIDGGDSLWNVVVSDNLAVWRAYDGSAYRIYACDLAAANPQAVDVSGSMTNVDDFHTKGRVVVWVSGSTPSMSVHIYRFDTEELVTVPVTITDSDPYVKTDGRFVTWIGGLWPNFQIYAYDLDAASPAAIQLSSGSWNVMPVVDNGVVAWYTDAGGGNYEIYYADAKLATPVATRVTNSAVADAYPEIADGVIVWAGGSGNDQEIYYYDTGASSPAVVRVTNNATADGAWPSIPRIGDGLIVWGGAVDGVTGTEIFYYDLLAASPAVVRLTNNGISDQKPRVSHGTISWIADGKTYAARR
jgi:hypothetical protein